MVSRLPFHPSHYYEQHTGTLSLQDWDILSGLKLCLVAEDSAAADSLPAGSGFFVVVGVIRIFRGEDLVIEP